MGVGGSKCLLGWFRHSFREESYKIWTSRKFVQKCHKMAQKWPKMTQSGPIMTLNGPRMTQNYPKLPKKNTQNYPQMAQKWCPDLRTFPHFFLTEKAVPQTFSLLECMHRGKGYMRLREIFQGWGNLNFNVIFSVFSWKVHFLDHFLWRDILLVLNLTMIMSIMIRGGSSRFLWCDRRLIGVGRGGGWWPMRDGSRQF